ncbi:MAG: NAD(P)-dependent oxidoreductase [Alphaproteobacteria bacterium]|nr:NAD(P)-dependent oxidoreductase [Alphaproteobacteria bacterium]
MNSGKKRLLVTGASGFIGSHLLSVLSKTDEWTEIHALSRMPAMNFPTQRGVIWHQADLLADDTPTELITQFKPSHVVHAAWITDHGAFWEHQINSAWLVASLKLAQAFMQSDGERFITLGSVAEYDWTQGRMIEGHTPETPSTLYGQAKLAFHQALTEHNKRGHFSSATCRIFYTYGPFENPKRLVPLACRSLITEHSEAFGSGSLWRDYIHVSDLVRGIASVLLSDLEGAVNIGSGAPVRISFLLDQLEKLSDKPGFLKRGQRPDLGNEVMMIFADVSRLGKLGWRPIVSFEEGLNHSLQWWRKRLMGCPELNQERQVLKI